MDALIVLTPRLATPQPKECPMDDHLTWLVMKQPGLKPAAKMVLYWIAESHDQTTDECVVGIGRLAQLCVVSRKCVQMHLTNLKKAGLISIQPRFKTGRVQDVNAYRLRLS
jgi:DNA-binding MarR family transcriptional regulator